MPLQSPVPEDVDRGYFEACNEERLVIQNCTACNRLQHPPKAACPNCGSSDNLEWKQVSGKGNDAGSPEGSQTMVFSPKPFSTVSSCTPTEVPFLCIAMVAVEKSAPGYENDHRAGISRNGEYPFGGHATNASRVAGREFP